MKPTLLTHHTARLLPLVALVIATQLAPQSALAQTVASDESVESPQRFAFEARFGPYMPDVDANLGETSCGGGPYTATFGDQAQFYTEFQFDWQPLRFFIGSLGIGAAVGVMHATANAFAQGSCTRTEDETGLWMLPLTAVITARIDYLANELSVPFVPYFKFGVTYALWWATDANGISQSDDGTQGFGGTAGLRVGGGVMFRLDWIEPQTARTFDNEFGVNHSYLFFEWYYAWLNGFGDESRMNLTSSTWVGGLALEF